MEDKSKGDALSKTFSILQMSWFIVQCIAQAVQHLPITLLEVTALAFTGLSIITYCLSWNKPLNVKYHISLDGSDLATLQMTQGRRYTFLVHYLCKKQGVNSFWGFFLGIVCMMMGESDHNHGHDAIGCGITQFSSGRKDKQSTRFTILVGVGSLFGVFHCAAWSFSFPSYTEMVLWRFSAITVLIEVFAASSLPVMETISKWNW